MSAYKVILISIILQQYLYRWIDLKTLQGIKKENRPKWTSEHKFISFLSYSEYRHGINIKDTIATFINISVL